MEASKKQYGLLFLKKDKGITGSIVKKPAAFNSDSDEESNSVDWLSQTTKKEIYGSGKSRQMKADIDRVLKDDPTAYQYDEIYDEMKDKKDEAVSAKKKDRNPKYMPLLLKQAERRKKEDERRKERQIQKEREAEGDEFADKEVFVTSSYKKKLEELRKMDEEDERMERLEEIGDVTKQCDLGGFYRHLYENMTTTDAHSSAARIQITSAPLARGTDSTAGFREFEKKARNIRKRVSSDDEKEVEADADVDCELQKGIGCDSRVQTSSTKTEEDSCQVSKLDSGADAFRDAPKSTRAPLSESKFSIEATKAETGRKDEGTDDCDGQSGSGVKAATLGNESNDGKKSSQKKRKMAVTPERRVDIWLKRTVGEAFEAALLRYEERKANRIATLS